MTSCNENPLDVTCTCSSKFASGTLSRIYDIGTEEYVCCGNVGYDMYDALNIEGNILKAGASMDDPRCETWWTGIINPLDTVALPLAGPSSSKVAVLESQVNISNYFPNPNINGVTNTFSCVGIESSGLPLIPTVPKYVVYQNPNAGETFIETIQCVPKGGDYQALSQTSFASTGNFAIYSVNGCNDTTSVSPPICMPANGITGISIGSQEFKSSNYTGYITPDSASTEAQIPWIILMVVLVILFIILIVILFRASGKDSTVCPSPPPCNNLPPPPKPVCVPPPPSNYVQRQTVYPPVATTTTTDFNIATPYAKPLPQADYVPTVVPTNIRYPVPTNVVTTYPSGSVLEL